MCSLNLPIGVVWLFVYSYQEVVTRQDIVGSTLLLTASAGVALLPFTSSTGFLYAYICVFTLHRRFVVEHEHVRSAARVSSGVSDEEIPS